MGERASPDAAGRGWSCDVARRRGRRSERSGEIDPQVLSLFGIDPLDRRVGWLCFDLGLVLDAAPRRSNSVAPVSRYPVDGRRSRLRRPRRRAAQAVEETLRSERWTLARERSGSSTCSGDQVCTRVSGASPTGYGSARRIAPSPTRRSQSCGQHALQPRERARGQNSELSSRNVGRRNGRARRSDGVPPGRSAAQSRRGRAEAER